VDPTTLHRVLARAAEGLAGYRWHPEAMNEANDVNPILRTAFEDELGLPCKSARKRPPAWATREIGTYDLVVDPDPTPKCVGELKWLRAGRPKCEREAIWDLGKVAAATSWPTVEAVLLVAGASRNRWDEENPGAEYYGPGTWELRYELSSHGRDWFETKGPGHPRELPARLTADAPDPVPVGDSGWTLHGAVMVAEWNPPLKFVGDWPTELPRPRGL
jgi:hypothetical protein